MLLISRRSIIVLLTTTLKSHSYIPKSHVSNKYTRHITFDFRVILRSLQFQSKGQSYHVITEQYRRKQAVHIVRTPQCS